MTRGNDPIPESDLNFQHLQAELARIDLLIRRQAHLWYLASQDPADVYRGLYVSDAEASLSLAFRRNWVNGRSLQRPERYKSTRQANKRVKTT